MINTFKPDWTIPQVLTNLEAENKRLREALEKIKTFAHHHPMDTVVYNLANEALKGDE